MRDKISFYLNGQLRTVAPESPTQTLLDYLRLDEGQIGTKEGCCEGDCGACTVAVGDINADQISYRPVNSCIYLLGMLDGKALKTVEGLSGQGEDLHPVQTAMVDTHASQCGFCTPGFVMSLYTLFESEEEVTTSAVNDALSGNLCRCTGYRPIRDAAKAACAQRPAEKSSAHLTELDSSSVFIGSDERFLSRPSSAAELTSLLAEHPDATIVAGATDVGLWITKHLQDLPKIISISNVRDLNYVNDENGMVSIGASVTYQDAQPALSALHSDIAEVLRRLGSRQVRASGTVVGNIANGSPIGDTPPLFIALEASITLSSISGNRALSLEDFFIEYGKQDLRDGEFVRSVSIPKLKDNQVFRAAKLSKRYDQDISAVLGAMRLTLDGETITDARMAFGGMAGTPKRARKTETALVGRSIGDVPNPLLFDSMKEDFTPLSDMRASAEYRHQAATGLLIRFLAELNTGSSSTTRVFAGQEAGA